MQKAYRRCVEKLASTPPEERSSADALSWPWNGDANPRERLKERKG
jgi:hypothetical protein